MLVTLGGGHYAPRANQLAALDGVWLGHMLATYALPFEQRVRGKHGDMEAINSRCFGSDSPFVSGGELICSMDKKAFRGWQRQAIRDLLEEEGIPLLTTKQIKTRLGLA